ncbi:peptidylprolyl isomerase [Paenibacillus sp. y28]|uniref:peptidylprolyl isomerase n=1 Tax=Paenibacillus sp. y28 TaxID=3129110 RepID=UPI003017EA23
MLHNRLYKMVTMLSLTVLLLAACGQKSSETTGQGTASPTPASSPSSAAAGNTGETKTWAQPPIMQIDVNKTYHATIETNMGSFKIGLFPKEAPKTVNNFVFLAKEGFYNGVIFHRVIKDFMIQGGDPTGTGRGGPGYKFEDELKTPYKYEEGTVAMANSGPNTNGSQFFVCTNCAGLNKQPNYTIFGKVVEGMDVVTQISLVPTQKDRPVNNVAIKSITIEEK